MGLMLRGGSFTGDALDRWSFGESVYVVDHECTPHGKSIAWLLIEHWNRWRTIASSL